MTRTRTAREIAACLLCAVACGGNERPAPDGDAGSAGSAGTNAPAAGTSGSSSSGASGSGTSGSGGAATTGGSAGESSKAGSGGASGGASAGSGAAAGGAAGSGGADGTAGSASGAGGAAGSGGASGTAGAGGAGGASGSGPIQGAPVEAMLEDLPAVRQEHAVVAAAGEVYVIGGYTPQISASVLAYDPGNDSWRERADFPGPMNHANAAAVADKIYVAGFYVGGMSTVSAQTFVYDPPADAWEELTPMPDGTERAAACAAVLGTKIYLFGGARENAVVAEVSAYDTASDEWEELAPLPETREHCVAGAIGGKLYIGGGRTHSIPEFRPNTWEFDPGTGMYTQKASIPTPRGGVAGGVLYDRLFVIGGEGNQAAETGVFPDIEAYNPATDAWEAFPPLLEPRHGLGGAVLDGRLYLPGGAERQGGDQYEGNSVFYFD
jgi:N-acetylneuraminic acid mutarotase